MNKKNFIDAMENINHDFLEEYSSYVPKKRVYTYTVMKVLAACLALLLCGGAVLLWVGNNRTPQKNQGLVADHKKPEDGLGDTIASQEPQSSNQPQESYVAQMSQEPQESLIPSVSREPQISQHPETQPEENKEQHKDTVSVIQAQKDSQEKLNVLDKPKSTEEVNYSNDKESEKEPVVTVMPKPTQVPVTTGVPGITQEPAMTELPENTKQPSYSEPDKTEEPDESQQVITASGWMKVDIVNTPCKAEIEQLDNWNEEDGWFADNTKTQYMDRYLTSNKGSNVYVAGTVVTNKNGESWNLMRLNQAPVSTGWYWFDTMSLTWEEDVVVQEPKEMDKALSNVRLIKGNKTMYILQTKTDATNLTEANKKHPEKLFDGNLMVSYWGGIPMYLLENSNGELYMRFLVGDTLITIIDKGYGKEVLDEMVRNIKKTF